MLSDYFPSNMQPLKSPYEEYKDSVRSLPHYIKKNLYKMPANRGYVHEGTHFYGNLPAEDGPLVMFEKLDGGVLRIYESTEHMRKVFEKVGDERKRLVHKQVRKLANSRREPRGRRTAAGAPQASPKLQPAATGPEASKPKRRQKKRSQGPKPDQQTDQRAGQQQSSNTEQNSGKSRSRRRRGPKTPAKAQ